MANPTLFLEPHAAPQGRARSLEVCLLQDSLLPLIRFMYSAVLIFLVLTFCSPVHRDLLSSGARIKQAGENVTKRNSFNLRTKTQSIAASSPSTTITPNLAQSINTNNSSTPERVPELLTPSTRYYNLPSSGRHALTQHQISDCRRPISCWSHRSNAFV